MESFVFTMQLAVLYDFEYPLALIMVSSLLASKVLWKVRQV